MIDIVFAVLMVIAILKGMRKGLIVALFSIIAYIIGLAAAMKLSAVVALHLQRNTEVPGKWLPFLSFALVFVVVVILVNWGGKLVEKAFELAFMGLANKILGATLYVLLYAIIFSIFLFFGKQVHLLKPESLEQSMIYPYISNWGPLVIDNFGKLIPWFKDSFSQLESFFGELSDKIKPQ